MVGVLENPLMQRTSPPEPPDENLFNKRLPGSRCPPMRKQAGSNFEEKLERPPKSEDVIMFGVLENPLMQRTSPPEPPDENLFNKRLPGSRCPPMRKQAGSNFEEELERPPKSEDAIMFGVLENPLMQRISPPEPPDENLFNKRLPGSRCPTMRKQAGSNFEEELERPPKSEDAIMFGVLENPLMQRTSPPEPRDENLFNKRLPGSRCPPMRKQAEVNRFLTVLLITRS